LSLWEHRRGQLSIFRSFAQKVLIDCNLLSLSLLLLLVLVISTRSIKRVLSETVSGGEHAVVFDSGVLELKLLLRDWVLLRILNRLSHRIVVVVTCANRRRFTSLISVMSIAKSRPLLGWGRISLGVSTLGICCWLLDSSVI